MTAEEAAKILKFDLPILMFYIARLSASFLSFTKLSSAQGRRYETTSNDNVLVSTTERH